MELYQTQIEENLYLDGVKVYPDEVVGPKDGYGNLDGWDVCDLVRCGRLVSRADVEKVPNPDLVKIVQSMEALARSAEGKCYWKIPAIKLVRTLTGAGLREAKDFVEQDCGLE